MLEPDYVQQDMPFNLPLAAQLEEEAVSQQGLQQEFRNSQHVESRQIEFHHLVTEPDEASSFEETLAELAESALQEVPVDRTASDLLDPSSLKTVLDMLELIDSIEELALLETLTPAQKRQVWEATPEVTRLKLKTIRATASLSATEPIENVSTAAEVNPMLEAKDLTEEAIEDTTENLAEEDLLPDTLWQPQPQVTSDAVLIPPTKLTVGDWVVLYANPKLTAAEMKAIWQVLEIQGDYAQVHARTVGTRHYPIAWMAIYPNPSIDQA